MPITIPGTLKKGTILIRDTFAEFCTTLGYATLTEDAIRFTKLCWMDQIGLLIASQRTYLEDYPDIGELISQFGGKQESTVIGTGKKIPCLNATLVNTAIGINDHYDAVHKSTIIHLPASLLPALLAVSERQKASGKDLILASVIGAEVMARFGIAMGASSTYARGFHPTSICAPLGCAAGTGRLLGLNKTQFAEALSLAAVQASGSSVWAGPVYPASWSFQAAKGAESGVLAALLAQTGFTGVENIFDHERGFLNAYSQKPDSTKLTEGLGQTYEIAEVSFKRIGVGVYIMTAIEGLIETIAKNRIDPGEIREVSVKLATVVVPLVGFAGYPENRAATHLNTRYILAVAAYRGNDVFYSMEPFGTNSRNDPRIVDLFKKIEIMGEPELDRAFPQEKACILEIKTSDGKQIVHRYNGPFKGDPANPLSADDIETKFNKMSAPILGPKKAAKIASVIKDLDQLDDVTRLVDLLIA